MTHEQRFNKLFAEFGESEDNLYAEGFHDGVDDTVERIISFVKNNVKKTQYGHTFTMDDLLAKLNKIKNRT